MKTLIFEASDALRAITTKPDTTLELKKQQGKKATRVPYYDMFLTVGNMKSKGCWFHVENIPLITGVCDSEAAKQKFTDDPERQRMQLTTSVSNAGDFGQFLLAFGPAFEKEVQRLIANGDIDYDNQKTHMFAQTNISKKNTDPTLKGKEIEDPVLRFTIDFGESVKWRNTSYVWGKKTTQFFDYDTAYEDENGKTQYHIATLKNDQGEEVPVDASNIHEFISPGCIIRSCELFMASASVSQSWISSKITVANCIVERSNKAEIQLAKPVFDDVDVANAIGEGEKAQTITTPVVEKKEETADSIVDSALGEI